MDEATVKHDLLKDTLKELDLLSDPALIYNMHDRGMSLDPIALNAIA